MRELKYEVLKDKNHTEPRTRQWAGMQYEDNVTEVIFDVSALGIESALYRIDFNSAGAGYQPSENLLIEEGLIKRSIPQYVTQYGGEVQITAVITLLDENGEATGICLSYPVLVYFTEVEKDTEGSKEVEGNISAAEASALDAAERAEMAAEAAAESEVAAEDAKEKTEAARRALEEGSTFVFLGGDATGAAEVELVVDKELSPASTNAVENRAVYEGIEAVKETFASEVENTNNEVLYAAKEYTDEETDQALQEAKEYIDNKIIISTDEPTDAADGVIWIQPV